ncbi:hypothetical protein GUJ93_ZPchr0013g35543 [Zizania palustris]|uniref:EF-hand domain-containing protein n=1 Tax=Zizania palustris TaxID=103762 RepID=A0A8J5WWX8_ZIZPA|nr:hypothetical protein GUJ93_ZPchr0013g35543 [Zizania palustris]
MWQLVAPPIYHMHNGVVVVSVSSLLIMLVVRPLVKSAILMSRGARSVSHALVSLLLDRCIAEAVVAVDAHQPRRRQCERCAGRRGGGEDGARQSRHDVAVVMESLGLVGVEEDEEGEQTYCDRCEAASAVEELTESKVAGEDELREAFYVFDRDENGYITAAELRNVLRRLGMEEGGRYGDCERMIAAHDGDGDGRVSFREFRTMMDNAV